MSFAGSKLALFVGARILTILRDDRPDIPYPNHWDLPGGGREGGESPEGCALRETQEEVGLIVSETELVWSKRYQRPHGVVWFFAAHLPESAENNIVFGSEGQEWRLMAPDEYMTHPRAVPHFRDQLREYLEQNQP